MESELTPIEVITESANLSGHIDFIEQILERYEWCSGSKQELTQSLGSIKEKQNDKRLYMAVVGEFTSGKSSFINAILRDDLLKTDILQATTTTATLIEYGDKLDVEVNYAEQSKLYSESLSFGKKLWRKVFKPKFSRQKSEIREYIASVTANEETARGIESVKILHPSESLSDGLVIIDTPGTNALNDRHEAVTSKAIRDLSDAAIIIIPSNVPLGGSLLSFIKDNLDDVISKCIFIVNKMDLITVKEQKRVLTYISQRLKQEFCIENVTVVPYTPHTLLREVSAEITLSMSETDQKFLLEQSLNTENQIFDILRQQRLIVQLQKMAVLLNDLFGSLEQNLYQLEHTYAQRHEALIKNQIKDLGTFIRNQKSVQLAGVRDGCQMIRHALFDKIYATQNELLKEISDRIYGFSSHGDLNAFMKKKLTLVISQKQFQLQQQLPNFFVGFQSIAIRQRAIFETEFKKLYENLSTLGGQISLNEQGLSLQTSNAVSGRATEQLTTVKNIVSSENNKNIAASFGGAGAGALIGSVIFPGVGTAIGAAIGSLAGLIFRKPLNELKNQYYNTTKDSIEKSFAAAHEEIGNIADFATNSAIMELGRIIDSYFVQYDSLVRQMIYRDENEKRELELKGAQIKYDLSELKNRRDALESIRDQIKKM